MAGTEAPQMQVFEPIAVALDGRPYLFRHAAVGFMSSRMAPVSRMSPYDHDAITSSAAQFPPPDP